MIHVEALKVYRNRDRHVIYVPDGRGEELRIHLASHGVAVKIVPSLEAAFERVEIEGGDTESLQALVDQWER